MKYCLVADGMFYLLSGYHGNCSTALYLHLVSPGGKHKFYISDVGPVITCMLAVVLVLS